MNHNEPLSLVVIGGGAAGMIAAWRAGSLGAKMILLEKNSKLGIKLLISGGGKCNITHGGKVEDLCKQFRSNESKFLKHSLYRFTNRDILSFIDQFGVETYERENGRIFPTSGKAGDVVHALRRMMERENVEIRLAVPVEKIIRDDEGVCGVMSAGWNNSNAACHSRSRRGIIPQDRNIGRCVSLVERTRTHDYPPPPGTCADPSSSSASVGMARRCTSRLYAESKSSRGNRCGGTRRHALHSPGNFRPGNS